MSFEYITEQGRNALKQYKYHGADGSYLTPYFVPFWNWSVTLLPMWMAPNLVTLVGFFGILLHYGLTVYYATNLDGSSVPSWVWYVNALSLFWYMTLDAIDGKQARRTGSSSPLGELFDHIVHATFFLAIWEQYYTGILRFSSLSGPTEALLTAIALHLFTAVYGHGAWKVDVIEYFGLSKRIPYVLQLNQLVLIWSVIMAVPGLIDNVRFVYHSELTNEQMQLKGTAFRAAFPFLFLISTWSIWMIFSPEDLIHSKPVLGFSIFGLITGYLCTRMVISRVCGETCQGFYIILYPLAPIALHAVISKVLMRSLISEIYVFGFYWIYVSLVYAHMTFGVINQMCEALNIRCFTIKSKDE